MKKIRYISVIEFIIDRLQLYCGGDNRFPNPHAFKNVYAALYTYLPHHTCIHESFGRHGEPKENFERKAAYKCDTAIFAPVTIRTLLCRIESFPRTSEPALTFECAPPRTFSRKSQALRDAPIPRLRRPQRPRRIAERALSPRTVEAEIGIVSINGCYQAPGRNNSIN